MDIKKELISFLESDRKGVGKPKLNGTPRKLPEQDAALRARNQDIILSYYGFGSGYEFWPTYEDLAERHNGLSRARIRQVIEREYEERLEGPLPIALQVASVLDRKDIWTEEQFLRELQDRGLAGELDHAIALLVYLQTQSLATDYAIYLPTLQRISRSTYFDANYRVIAKEAKVRELRKGLKAARKLPGRVGLANLRHLKRRGSDVDVEGVKSLISMSRNAWTAVNNGEFWFNFEDQKDHRLLNAAEKTFAITDTCPLDELAEILHNSLFRQACATEYPNRELVRTWISQSRHFNVIDGMVTFNGEPAPLAQIERALVEITRGERSMLVTTAERTLVSRGFGHANVKKTVRGSPLILVDKSGGHGKSLLTLVSELRRPSGHQINSAARKPEA